MKTSSYLYNTYSIFLFFFQGKAEGQRSAVWLRARLQDQLSQLGYFLQRHAGKVLFVAVLALATFCVALKSAQVHSKVDQLWVQGKCDYRVHMYSILIFQGCSLMIITQCNTIKALFACYVPS